MKRRDPVRCEARHGDWRCGNQVWCGEFCSTHEGLIAAELSRLEQELDRYLALRAAFHAIYGPE